jgi:type I restriction enzyme R subunit
MVERMEGNEEIFSRLMSDEEFRKMASEHLLNKICRTIKNEKAKTLP